MKYMGSKSRIAKDICPIIQSFIDKTGSNNYLGEKRSENTKSIR